MQRSSRTIEIEKDLRNNYKNMIDIELVMEDNYSMMDALGHRLKELKRDNPIVDQVHDRSSGAGLSESSASLVSGGSPKDAKPSEELFRAIHHFSDLLKEIRVKH